jgi:hypothetical protein
MNAQEIDNAVEAALRGTPFIDIHTHLFDPSATRVGQWRRFSRPRTNGFLKTGGPLQRKIYSVTSAGYFAATSSDGRKSVRIESAESSDTGQLVTQRS